MKDILEGSTASREGWRSDESSQESKNTLPVSSTFPALVNQKKTHQTGKVVDKRGWHLKDTEQGQCDDVWDTSTDLGDLTDGREEQWANTVADDEKRQGQSSSDWPDTKDH